MRRSFAIVSLAVCVSVGDATATAQTASGVFAGSVAAGTATSETLQLGLQDAVSRGLQHNLGIIAVEQQVASARGSRLRTLRELLPRADARVSDVRQTSNLAAFGFDSSLFPGIPTLVGPYSIFDARVSVSQTLFDLSARSDLRNKDAALAASQADSENARDVVAFVVTSLYFQAASSASRIDSVRSQVTTAEALLAQATTLRNAGAAPGIDVARAGVQVQVQKQRLIAAETDYAKQVLQLQRAIGIPTGQHIELADRTLALTTPPLTLDDALGRAARSRADYRASVERVRAAEAALKASRQDALPVVAVAGDVGTIGSNPGNARRTYAMSANVRVPLFDPDRTGRVIENTAILKQRQAESADLQQRIEADVRSAFLDVQAAEQQVAVARERAALANQELSLSRVRFSAGVTSNLEVTQAQNEVAQASENEVTAVLGLNIARAALTRAVGD